MAQNEELGEPEALFFSDNGNNLITESSGGIITWDIATGTMLERKNITESQGLLSPDGRLLVRKDTEHKKFYIYDTSTGAELHRWNDADLWYHPRYYDEDSGYYMKFSHDSSLLAVIYHGLIEIWEMAEGTLVSEIGYAMSDPNMYPLIYFSTDDSLLFWESDSQIIGVAKIATGVTLHKVALDDLPTDHISFRSLALSPDNRVLATAADEAIYLWDTNTGELLHSLLGHEWLVTSLVFSANSQALASFSAPSITRSPSIIGSLRVWDMQTYQQVQTWTFGEQPLPRGYDAWNYHSKNLLLFSNDADKLALGLRDDVLVYDVASGDTLLLLQLQRHNR